eukprot:scaffold4889_cov136-Amphora_coffeaeformis.AAC.2
MMQLFYGMSSGHMSGYPIPSEKQVGEVYEDHIGKVGAPVGILSDRARSEVHGKAKDIMHMYKIDDGQSEPGYQHQNPAERQIQNIKRNMNNVMDQTGCPSCWWLLTATFVIILMNHLPNLDGEIPITKITGQIPDDNAKNLLDGYLYDVPIKLPKFSPEELLGLTFLHDVDDGQQVRAKIVKKILDRDAKNHERIKMLITYDDDKIEEIVAYNKLCDIVAEQHEKELNGEADLFTFVDILEHEGPLCPTDSNYKGSSYNVKMLWNDGSKTWESRSMIMATDPVTLAVYAKEHGLLKTPGWKKLKKYARRTKKLMRMVNQNKRAQRFNAVTYKFGVRLPRNVPEAYRLNEKNGNMYWANAIKLEIEQLMEYKTFRDMGSTTRIPPGYQQIPL